MKWLFFTLLILFPLWMIAEQQQDKPSFQIQKAQQYPLQKIPSDIIDQRFELYGKLEKIGNSIYFTTNDYQEGIFVTQRYTVVNFLYQENTMLWVKATGKYVKVIESYIEIEIEQYNKLDKWKQKLEEAQQKCHKWVVANLPGYNLNEFKNTERFKVALKHLKNTDLNLSSYQKDKSDSISYIDYDKMIIGIKCGKSKLYTSEIRGDFLSYIAVYDLKQEKLLKVCIINTGYYLE